MELDAEAAARLMGVLASGPIEATAPGSMGSGAANGPEPHADFPPLAGFYFSRQIGAGSGGVVYEAHRAGSEQRVAVKVMASKLGAGPAARRTWRELEMMSQVRLPVLPRLLEWGEVDGRLYIVSEYVEGLSLDRFCGVGGGTDAPRVCAASEPAAPIAARSEKPPPSRRERVQLLVQVCRAVQSLHERGVIHRDLKPSNILVTSQGDPVIIDLGIATLLSQDGQETLTIEGCPIGSPAFMSPEQARGEHAEVSTRSDVYALGATGYLLLTGSTPHRMDGSLHASIRRVADEPARDPSEIEPYLPRSLSAVLRKACERSAGKRYASAQALADDLERWLAGDRVEALPPAVARRLAGAVRRHPVRCFAVLASIFGACTWWWIARPIPPQLVGSCAPPLGGEERVTSVVVVSERVVMVGRQRGTNGDDGLLLEFDRSGQRLVSVGGWPGVTGGNALFGAAALSDPGTNAALPCLLVCGSSQTLTVDTTGGKEAKGIVARIGVPFASSAERIEQVANVHWYQQVPAVPGAFSYGGDEAINAVAVTHIGEQTRVFAVGSGNIGSGRPRMFVSLLDRDGELIRTWCDQGNADSAAMGVAVAAGMAYVVGWERAAEACIPLVRVFNSLNHLVAEYRRPTGSGWYSGVCELDGGVVMVGCLTKAAAGTTPGEEGQVLTDGMLVDRLAVGGRQIWNPPIRRGERDQLRSVCVTEGRIFAVGSTRNGPGGGSDSLLLEISSENGSVLSVSFDGGEGEDEAVAIDADGRDLYVATMTGSDRARQERLGRRVPKLLHFVVSPRGRP